MTFDPTKTQPWDVYSYKIRPGFKASNDPIDRDTLHAQSLGIADWSPSDTALCEAQAEVGRKAFEKTATEIEAYNKTLDAEENAGYYRRENGGQGQAVADVDAIVSDTGTHYAITPITIKARHWFSIHYAGAQNAAGVFLFFHNEIIGVAENATHADLKFAKRQ